MTREIDVIRSSLVAGQAAGAGIEDEVVLARFSGGDDMKAHDLRPGREADEQARLVAVDGRDDAAALRRQSLEARPDDAVEFLGDERKVLPGLDRDQGMACRRDRLSGRFDDHIERKFDCNARSLAAMKLAAVPGGFRIASGVANLDLAWIDAGGPQSRLRRSRL